VNLTNDNKYKGDIAKSLKLDERNHVEEPFLKQLEEEGWKVLRLDNHSEPVASFRSNFNEVILTPVLKRILKKINPFLTEGQIDELVRKISSFERENLLENNQKILDYLLSNTTVSQNEVTGELSPTVRFIDFDNIDKNEFIAISQFKIRISGTENHIIPDIILFVNGLPLVVVECKSPKIKDSIAEAIDQLMRYSQQRNVGIEGNPLLFYYNQLLIVTDRQKAKFGTITTHTEKYFYRWTDPYPKTLDELQTHDGTSPNDQQRLIAGMLNKINLLDLLRSFTIFIADDKGKTIKIVGRYQQFRAVKKTVKQLLEGKNPRDRGGIIWHTQGSGKSLTMVFMVREMRKYISLQSWKILFVTDRTQLEDQLSETSKSIGHTVKVANSIFHLKELLRNPAPDLVMGMIHKFQERDLSELFPILNSSSNILVMTDEAHRSQYKMLGANLRKGLPNATHIAYTGTPIDKTEQHFGNYIDKYTMRQSIEDGVTLKIVYEGRTHNAEIKDPKGMDEKFEDVFSEYNLLQRLQILGYGTREAYLEAESTIEEKAADILEHYINYVFSNGLKAQIVATSRVAAMRYHKAITKLLPSIIGKLEKSNPACININRLKNIEFAVIISHSHNDPPQYKQFTNSDTHKTQISRFKLPFDKTEGELDGRVGILIVNEMLLTGFDAPIEQVMYLDRVVVDHNLLQAIARVNRVGPDGKDVGFIIDYIGIGHHIKKALDAYAEREQKEILESISNIENELNELIDIHRKIWEFLEKYKCTDLSDPDAFYDLFYDEDIRFEYILLFKQLTQAFNKVLPHPKALDYYGDYQKFLEINLLAAKHLCDNRLSMRGIPEKLRGIADEFLKSRGIEQKIAPISIIDDDFYNQIKTKKRIKTKAAEIEHAIRSYIDINIEDDPELFNSFSEALQKILEDFKGQWDKIYVELEKLRQKIKNREQEETYGLNRQKQMPFYRILKKELFGDETISEDNIGILVHLTNNLTNLLQTELKIIGFWDSITAQSKLKKGIQEELLSELFIQLPGIKSKYSELISRIMELARNKSDILTSTNEN
jgi:type I restriction enzyme R subunit